MAIPMIAVPIRPEAGSGQTMCLNYACTAGGISPLSWMASVLWWSW